jgi:hypothetical protein
LIQDFGIQPQFVPEVVTYNSAIVRARASANIADSRRMVTDISEDLTGRF